MQVLNELYIPLKSHIKGTEWNALFWKQAQDINALSHACRTKIRMQSIAWQVKQGNEINAGGFKKRELLKSSTSSFLKQDYEDWNYRVSMMTRKREFSPSHIIPGEPNCQSNLQCLPWHPIDQEPLPQTHHPAEASKSVSNSSRSSGKCNYSFYLCWEINVLNSFSGSEQWYVFLCLAWE